MTLQELPPPPCNRRQFAHTSQIWWAIFKLSHFLPVKALSILYKSLFEPHIKYCNIIWGNTFPSYLSTLKVFQKKVIRAISWSTNTWHSFSLLQLTESTLFSHNACFMYNIEHELRKRTYTSSSVACRSLLQVSWSVDNRLKNVFIFVLRNRLRQHL